MKRRLAAVVVAASMFGGVPAVAPVVGGGSPLAPAPASAKSCSSGYKHAVMPDGSHKCLRAGQFCSRKHAWQRVYKRKGFYCKPNRHLRRL